MFENLQLRHSLLKYQSLLVPSDKLWNIMSQDECIATILEQVKSQTADLFSLLDASSPLNLYVCGWWQVNMIFCMYVCTSYIPGMGPITMLVITFVDIKISGIPVDRSISVIDNLLWVTNNKILTDEKWFLNGTSEIPSLCRSRICGS